MLYQKQTKYVHKRKKNNNSISYNTPFFHNANINCLFLRDQHIRITN